MKMLALLGLFIWGQKDHLREGKIKISKEIGHVELGGSEQGKSDLL